MLKKIWEIKEVKLGRIENEPSKLNVICVGVVPSGGWTSPHLIPYVYLNPPPDGIYDFDIVANAPAPEASVIRITTPITCNYRLKDAPADLKGVKIHTSSNAMAALLESKSD